MKLSELVNQLVQSIINNKHPLENGLLILAVFAGVSGLLAAVLEILKYRHVINDRFVVRLFKHQYDYNVAAAIQSLLGLFAFLSAWAGDYLVQHPYNAGTMVGIAGILFEFATFWHRFAVGRSFRWLNDLLTDFRAYLLSKKPAASDGTPSA